MLKETFEEAELEIVRFEITDILVASCTNYQSATCSWELPYIPNKP